MRNPKAKVSDPSTFFTNPGSDDHVIFSTKILGDGTIALTPAGKESISEKINAQKEFTDIHFIVSRLMMGDTSVVRDGGFYADLTAAPKTLAEAMQIQIDAERAFYELPVEVRNSFNNNYRLWIQDAGSDDWIKKMNIAPIEVKEEVEVTEVE